MRLIDFPKIGKTLASAVQGAIYGAGAAIGLFMAVQAINVFGLGGITAVALMFLIVIAQMFFCLAIHELGHATAARLVGWRVDVITIGPFSYFPRERRFARPAKGRARGLVLALPQLLNTEERGRLMFILGGSLANFAFGAAGLSAALALRAQLGDLNGWAPLVGGLSINSVAFGIANLIPTWGKTTRSDGARFLEYVSEKPKRGDERNLVWLYSQWFYGVSSRYWDVERIRALWDYEGTDEENNRRDLILLSYNLTLADVERALAVTERHVRTARSKFTPIMLQHAFLIAFARDRAEEAKTILDEVPAEVRDSFHYWRALATVRSRLGELGDARYAVKAALARAERDKMSPDQDDRALFSAIEEGLPLPILVPRAAPA